MNRKSIVFIVGIIFYMSGIAISNKATIIGTIIGISGGGIMGLSFFLDKRKD